MMPRSVGIRRPQNEQDKHLTTICGVQITDGTPVRPIGRLAIRVIGYTFPHLVHAALDIPKIIVKYLEFDLEILGGRLDQPNTVLALVLRIAGGDESRHAIDRARVAIILCLA